MRKTGFEELYSPALEVRTFADIERFEEVPLDQRSLPDSTYDLIGLAASAKPEAIALHYFESGDDLSNAISITRGQVFEQVTKVANALYSFGLRPNDVVGVLMPIVPEAMYVIFGVEAACTVCPINWMLEPEIIARLLKAAGARCLVAYGPHEDVEAWHKAEQVKLLMPDLTLVFQVGGAAQSGDHIDLLREMENQPGDRLISNRKFKKSDLASLFHTGGTTGVPKLARHTHGNEVNMCWVMAMQLGVAESDVRICAVPMFHVAGVLTNLLMPVCRGASVVMLTANGWRNPSVIRSLWSIVETFKVTAMSLVPSVMSTALNIPVRDSDISSLQITTVGSAPLAVAVANAYRAHTGSALFEAYGLTEATALSAANPRYGESRIGSIGYRMAYQEMKIAKVGASGEIVRDCEIGESGAIFIRGPNLFPGYLDESFNAKAFTDGWFNTGDLGYKDADQYFWITGRAKDLIIRGGNNIDPRMIEEVLYAHPAIADAAAVGIPDQHAGELPVAYIVFKAGCEIPLGRVKHYAYEAIPERAAVPKLLFVRAELPKSAVGKIQKNILSIDAVRLSHEAALKTALGSLAFSVLVADGGDSGLRVSIEVRGSQDEANRKKIEKMVDDALLTLVVPREVVFESS